MPNPVVSYKRSADGLWLAVPAMGARALNRWLMLGQWYCVKYADGTIRTNDKI